MLSYFLKYRKTTESKNSRVAKTNKGKQTIVSKGAVCDSKKLKSMKEQEASGLLNSLGIRTSLNQIPIGGSLLFERYRMNEMVNNFLLVGGKFMPEMHLRQLGVTKKRIQKIKERRDLRYIYQNELNKACFQHDMVHGDLRDLLRKTASDKVLRDKAFNIAKIPKYDEYQRDLA